MGKMSKAAPQAPAPVVSDDGTLKVVNVERVSNNELRVLIESTNLERLIGAEAKKFAYEQRLKHGMANAGIEPVSGAYVPDEEYNASNKEKRDVAHWQREFRLVNML